MAAGDGKLSVNIEKLRGVENFSVSGKVDDEGLPPVPLILGERHSV
jgi:hypothetical protein